MIGVVHIGNFAAMEYIAASVMVVKGSIISVDPNSGKVAVIDDAGKTVELQAGSTDDIKTLQKGDEVMIEYDKKSVIQSIRPQS